MKLTIAFAVVVACVAATYAAPSAIAEDDKWTEIESVIIEKRNLIAFLVTSAKAYAVADKPIVGARITVKIDATAIRRTAIFQKLLTGTRQQTLTVAQAQTLTEEYMQILYQLQTNLESDLDLLSPIVAASLEGMGLTIGVRIEWMGQQITDLLNSGKASSFEQAQNFGLVPKTNAAAVPASEENINWLLISAVVTEAQMYILAWVPLAKAVVLGDNFVVGGRISLKIDRTSIPRGLIMQKLGTGALSKTLTEEQATALTTEYVEILNQLQADIQDDLSQLSLEAHQTFGLFGFFTYFMISSMDYQITELLNGRIPTASNIDWNAVASQMGNSNNFGQQLRSKY